MLCRDRVPNGARSCHAIACHFFVEPVGGLGSAFATTNQGNYLTAMALAVVFSAGTQIGFVVVVYSLISSGYDRYIGRAA